MRRFAAPHLAVVLFSGHSDVTKFRPWSTIGIGNHLNGNEKIPLFVQTIGNVEVFISHSGISVPTSRRASAGPNLREYWTQPTHVRTPVAQVSIKPKSDNLPS